MENLLIRNEHFDDAEAISEVVTAAFEVAEHSGGNESYIVEQLRETGALAVSLVAELEGHIVGHIALSPVLVNHEDRGWYGLGPVAVSPAVMGQGIGSQLVQAALSKIQRKGGKGCVLLGDPNYYQRFGFESGKGLVYAGVPGEYFMSLSFGETTPQGFVSYHPVFTEV